MSVAETCERIRRAFVEGRGVRLTPNEIADMILSREVGPAILREAESAKTPAKE